MIIRILKPAALLLGLLCLLSSCNNDRRISKQLLHEAAQVLEQKPGEALGLLHHTDINLLNEKEYAYYALLQVRALDKTGVSIASFEAVATAAKDVLIAANDAPKVAYACFVLANVADSQGKPSVMLHYDLQADMWAEKAEYSIPDFPYSFIPYNIAICYFDESRFEEALQFLNKALVYIDEEDSKYANHKQEILELKGLCFRNINAIDSAFYYYAKAMELAEAACDTVGINRIQYNRVVLLMIDDNYERAEERCWSLVASFPKSDSLNLGFMYVALSGMQLEAGKPDSARVNAYAAKEYLAVLANKPKIESYYVKHALYNQLQKAERAMNNITLADMYKQQRDSLIAEREASRKAELAEVEMLNRKQAGERAHAILLVKDLQRGKYQVQLNRSYLLYGILFTLVAAIILFLYWLRYLRNKITRKLILQEAVVSISSSSYLNLITEKAKRISDMDKKELENSVLEIADIADDLKHIVRQLPALTCSHSKLYRRIRKDYPRLTEVECYIFIFLNTRTLADTEIMNFLELTPERYASLKQSIYDKIGTNS